MMLPTASMSQDTEAGCVRVSGCRLEGLTGFTQGGKVVRYGEGLGPMYNVLTRLLFACRLSGLMIRPHQSGERLKMVRITLQTSLCQLDHRVDMPEATLQFHEDVLKNILLLSTSTAHLMDALHRRGDQVNRAVDIATHEGHFTFEHICSEG